MAFDFPPAKSDSRISNWQGSVRGYANIGQTPRRSVSIFAERALRNIWPPALLSLDAGCPDHLAPFLGLLGDELAEISGAHRHRRGAEIGEPRLDLGISKAGVDLLV